MVLPAEETAAAVEAVGREAAETVLEALAEDRVKPAVVEVAEVRVRAGKSAKSRRLWRTCRPSV